MLLYPAIDIIDGQAVRLDRGDFSAQTTYDSDPLEAASRWVAGGARVLHVIDLDGARAGAPANLEHVRRISQLGVPVQVGGGLRSAEAVTAVLEAGASRVILGTAAFKDPDFLQQTVREYGDRVIVSVDTRQGRFAAAGWTEQTEITTAAALETLSASGVSRFVYSSIDRDGMLTGPDLEGAQAAVAQVPGEFIYSGGVSVLEDLIALRELKLPKLAGVIVGKALYESRFTVTDAQAVLDGER